MFSSVGISELVVIAGIALVLLGPEQFPRFTKFFLRTIRDLRGYVEEIKRDLREEIKPVTDEMKELSRYDPETYIDAIVESEGEEEENGGPVSPSEGNGTPIDPHEERPTADRPEGADTTPPEPYDD